MPLANNIPPVPATTEEDLPEEFESIDETGAEHHCTLAGPSLVKQGIHIYESDDGSTVECALGVVAYVTRRPGRIIVRCLQNAAAPEVEVPERSLERASAGGLPRNRGGRRVREGDILLLINLERNRDPERFSQAANAILLRSTDDDSAEPAPAKPKPPTGGNGSTHAGNVLTRAVDLRRRYSGRFRPHHSGEFGFVHGTTPELWRDPYISRFDVKIAERDGILEGDPITFSIEVTGRDELGERVIARDLKPC